MAAASCWATSWSPHRLPCTKVVDVGKHPAHYRVYVPLKAPIVNISEVVKNSVKLSFHTEHHEEMTCYLLFYKYLDSNKRRRQKLVEKNYEILQLHLHSGFQANVSVVVCDEPEIQISNWTQLIYKAQPVYIYNTSCYIYNITSLKCTWSIKKEAPNDTQYSFGLRFGTDVLPCQQYLTNQQNKNIGCNMTDVFANVDRSKMKLKFTVQFSNHDMYFLKSFAYRNIEILNPPSKITLSTKKKILKIQWNQPPSIQENLESHCFEYQIKLLEMKNNLIFRIFNTSLEEHTFLDLDQNRKYSVQIRGIKKLCAKSKLWGEWSEPLFIGSDNEGIPTWCFLLIIVICTCLFAVVLLYVLKRYNRKLFDAAIPVPSTKLKYWISSTEINFQKCVPVVPSESVPITDIEIILNTDCHKEKK
ncbi:interleukin-5 receptor subunit alpha-like [Pelobates cultripes]|uniref:Interleukin-5 receptor subunit alpha-like n=1 Tax=Pelobates cultripes TaxID=61616 RepID=A0AAD1QZT3_PELCU|nr:interleukin-5 receptor subunit alpha-like [Pelobates cultripes]